MSIQYAIQPLTSDIGLYAKNLDDAAKNSWGVALDNKADVLWVAQNGTGVVSRYTLGGSQAEGALTVPFNAPNTQGTPTGIVLNNDTNGWFVSGSNPARAITVTEDGIIAAFNAASGPNFIAVVNSPGKVFKGATLGCFQKQQVLFVANFATGVIEMYDSGWNLVTSFTDPYLLDIGYAPFNVAYIDRQLWVTYAKQDDTKTDDVKGLGNGFVDVFATDGRFIKRFANRGPLNSPWAIVQYHDQILIGNFGDGRFNLYDNNACEGEFEAPLRNADWAPLSVDGLWGIVVDEKNKLFFAAGINDEEDGLIGVIVPSVKAKNFSKDHVAVLKGRVLCELEKWHLL